MTHSDLNAVMLKYRGIALADSLREAADALAREVGEPQREERRRREADQFPFRAALAQHVRRLEARYSGLIEAAPDAMIVVDERREIVLVNAQAESGLGYARDQLVGLPLSTVLDGPLVDAGPAAAGAAAPLPGLLEMTAIRGDGVHFPVEVTWSTVETDGERLLSLALRDVTARKASERRLERLEARARCLLESAPDAMVVLSKRGGILMLNGRARTMFACDDDDLLGKPASVLVPDGLLQRLVAEDGGPAYRALMGGDAAPQTVEAVRRDGSRFLAAMTLGACKGPDGVLFSVLFREVAEPRRPAATDRDAELAAGALEGAPDPIIAVDARGDVVIFNRAAQRRLGYGEDEAVGLPATRIFPTGLSDRLAGDPLGLAETSLVLEAGAAIELTACCKDGTGFSAHVRLNRIETAEGPLTVASLREAGPVPAVDGPGTGTVGADALARRVRELTHTCDDLSDFAEVAANNLSSPLRRLVECGGRIAASLAEDLPAESPVLGGLHDLVEEAGRMQVLVADLLAYARIGAQALQARSIAGADIVSEAVQSLEREIAESGAQVTHADLPDIICDPAEMVVLFRHVIANAIAYRGAAPPVIRISAAPNSAGDWVLAVTDNGVGIERQYFERVFEMFQRLHRHRAVPGSGLGLAVCRRIAERHGGRMWVDSRPGIGSTFYIALPAGGQAQ